MARSKTDKVLIPGTYCELSMVNGSEHIQKLKLPWPKDIPRCECCGEESTLTINGRNVCGSCMRDGSATQMLWQGESSK